MGLRFELFYSVLYAREIDLTFSYSPQKIQIITLIVKVIELSGIRKEKIMKPR